MKIRISLTLALLFFSAGVCSAADEHRAGRSPGEAIRLGATVPLTGDFASYGSLIQDGIELALSDLKEQGYRVEMFYEDVNSPGQGAVTAIRKLIDQNKIHALAGNFLNPAMVAMASDITRSQIVAFHTAAADDVILNSGDYIVTTNSKIRDEARKMADYAYSELGARTACVLYITTTFGENYATHFSQRFKEHGGRVLLNDTTRIGENDLRGVLTKVKAHQPDLLFAGYFGTNLGVVLKQARELGMTQPILSVYEAEDPSVLETAGEHAEGVQFYVPEPRRPTERRKEFLKRFEQRYGYTPRILATNAYDATKILVPALAGCNFDTECVKQKIYRVKNYVGVSGTFSVDTDGGSKKEFVLKTVHNQQFVRVMK